jgi:guanine deaminase
LHILRFGRLVTPLRNGDALDLAPAWLACDRAGLVLALGPGDPPPALAGLPETNLRRFVGVPGFVDAHLHFPQVDVRGRPASDLLTWLERHVFPAEEACADPRVARDLARRTFSELVRNGVTTAGVFGSSHPDATHAAFLEAERSGLRITMGMVLMDRNAPDGLLLPRAPAVEASRRLCRRWNGRASGRLRYAFSPRFGPSCTFELLREAGLAARELGAAVQTHLSESRREVAWVRELFPGSQAYAEVYRAAGLLGPHTVLGHAVHLDDREWALLKVHDAAVAHCPTSNFFLRSGAFDLARALGERLRVGLGSDVGAGPSFSPFDVMRHAGYLTPLSPVEALTRATLGGAEALGVAERVGSLEVEKDADVAVLAPEAVDARVDVPLDILLSAFIHRGRAAAVAGVLVRGEWAWTDPALRV